MCTFLSISVWYCHCFQPVLTKPVKMHRNHDTSNIFSKCFLKKILGWWNYSWNHRNRRHSRWLKVQASSRLVALQFSPLTPPPTLKQRCPTRMFFLWIKRTAWEVKYLIRAVRHLQLQPKQKRLDWEYLFQKVSCGQDSLPPTHIKRGFCGGMNIFFNSSPITMI